MICRPLLPALLLLPLGAPAPAQTHPPARTPAPALASTPAQTPANAAAALRETVPVTVRDKKGKLVTTLTASDLALSVDGHSQPILSYSPAAGAPLSLAFVVDTSGKLRDGLAADQSGIRMLLNLTLGAPEDRAALLHFDRSVELLQDLTHEKTKLNDDLNLLVPTDSAGGHSGDEQFYDALYLTSREVLGGHAGRRAVVVLSDGVDRGSQESLEAVTEAAQKNGVQVYAIYFPPAEQPKQRSEGGGNGGGRRGGGFPGGGVGFPGGGGRFPGGGGGQPGQQPSGGGPSDGGSRNGEHGGDRGEGKQVLEQLARATGGRYFEAKKASNVEGFYQAIADELRSQYLLSFSVPAGAAGRFESIGLTVKAPEVTVQVPSGFYSRAGK